MSENTNELKEDFSLEEIKSDINNVLPNFLSVELSKYEIPSPTISKRNEWVCWGENNCFINDLIKSLEKSPIHNSAVRYKASLFAGENWKITNENELSESEINAVTFFLNTINRNNEGLSDILKRFAMDASLTGNAYLQVIWNKARNKITDVYHGHANCFAPSKVNSNGVSDLYYFSSDWSQNRKKEFEPIPIQTFDEQNPGGRQIIPFKLNYTTGDLYYGVPDYLPALPLIELTEEISYFWLNYIKSGFFGNTIITFPSGVPNDEIKRKIVADLEKLYQGRNRKHLYVNWATTKDNAPVIDNLSNTADLDKAFTVVSQLINESVSTAHKITSQRLFGITAGSTQIGQKDELISAWQILMNTSIYPVQVRIEQIINNILRINGWKARIELTDTSPLNFSFNEETLRAILSKDEMRAMINYAPISKDENIKPNLVEQLGVGGLQSLQALISDPALTPEIKLAVLVNVFALEKDKAIEIVKGVPFDGSNDNGNILPPTEPTQPTEPNNQ